MLSFFKGTKKNLQPEKFRKNPCKSLPKENEPEAGFCPVCNSMHTNVTLNHNSFILGGSEKSTGKWIFGHNID